MDNKQMIDTEEDEIDLLELFSFYLVRIKSIILAFVVGALVAGIYTKAFITPMYEASAKIYMVSATNGAVVDLSALNIGSELTSDYEVLMKIRPLLQDTIKELDLDYNYEELGDMVTISSIDDTRIVTVSVKSSDPEEAKEIANCISKKALVYLPELMETSTPHIAEYAVTPDKKCSPSLTKNVAIGAMACTILLLGVYTVQFLMDDTVKSGEDIEKLLGTLPLAVVPENKETSSKRRGKR